MVLMVLVVVVVVVVVVMVADSSNATDTPCGTSEKVKRFNSGGATVSSKGGLASRGDGRAT